ncbi:MAG: DUF5915 domain-containing protein, partial [Dehalococcoidales bacterium]|nr:DUF5915 domain-containing protein [Dehalococcoidales bacterium]
DTRLVMKVSSMGRAARSKAAIKVRQPLPHVVASVASDKEEEILERLKPQLLEELNIKELKVDSFRNVVELDGKGYVVVSSQEKTTDKKEAAVFVEGSYLVAVPTEIPEELRREGLAREIVHRLQTMRRSAGFDITDHITTYYQGEEYIEQVIETFADYIRRETLSDELAKGVPDEDVFSESYKIAGKEIMLAVVRLK